MIRKLRLENWRSYSSVSIDFTAGTTFVVASNGVGKTSLIEAVRWALFGIIAPDHSAVRAGAESAVASVELVLPDRRVLSVERKLGTGRRQYPVDIRLDGAQVSEADLSVYLIDAYGTEPAFLARLTMPAVDRTSEAPTALGLEGHLGRYYGIDGLRTGIHQLTERRKDTEAQIRRIKGANTTTAQRLSELKADVERTKLGCEQAIDVHRAARLHADQAKERDRRIAQFAAWCDRRAAWVEALDSLAVGLAAELGRRVSAADLSSALDEKSADLTRQVEAIRIEMAVSRARESTLVSNEEELSAAHDDCPVCRRPLDESTTAFAHQANARDLANIRRRQAELVATEADLEARRQRLESAKDTIRRTPSPGPQPEPQPDDVEAEPTSAEATGAVEDALAALVDAKAEHRRATDELNRAQEAYDAMAQLRSLFREDAILRAAIETAESTLTELLDDTIRPLASEVNQRWRAIFPDRGNIETRSSGDVTRVVGGQSLPFGAFSTGEGTSLIILLRLLVAQMASAIDFCWFDEPLEHLAPDTRRHVANILTRVTNGEHRLRQVVVTTYEEPLARHLQARDPDGVHLLDVRQAT